MLSKVRLIMIAKQFGFVNKKFYARILFLTFFVNKYVL